VKPVNAIALHCNTHTPLQRDRFFATRFCNAIRVFAEIHLPSAEIRSVPYQYTEEPTVSPTYRVRYSMKASGVTRSPVDVVSVDLAADLDQIPGLLPASAYIMYIENLTAGQSVHWTRWPKAYRPGYGG